LNGRASGSVEKILVVRLSAMGDIIHTLPAVHALRDSFPNASIGWLIEERWAELLCAAGTPRRGARSPERPLVDWVHTVNLVGWRKSLFSLNTAEQIARVWNDVRSVGYEIALDLQGAIRSAVLARWSGAPVIYGSAQPREAPASIWYTRPVIPRGTHVIEQNLSIVEALVGNYLDVPAGQLPEARQAQDRIAQKIPSTQFAIVNPGAGWGAKRWPAERYGQVARALAACGLLPVINYGPGEDNLARETEAASGGTAKPLRCSISELIALTRRAKLFIGGDTGPLHLAAALGVPVVAIFGPTDPARNGPYEVSTLRNSKMPGQPRSAAPRAPLHVVLRNPASETSHARRTRPEEGMLEISADAVIHAARTLLARDRSEATHG
jgi:heptosyltransferase-1